MAQLRGDEEVDEQVREEQLSHMDRVQQKGVVEMAQDSAEKGAMTGETLGK